MHGHRKNLEVKVQCFGRTSPLIRLRLPWHRTECCMTLFGDEFNTAVVVRNTVLQSVLRTEKKYVSRQIHMQWAQNCSEVWAVIGSAKFTPATTQNFSRRRFFAGKRRFDVRLRTSRLDNRRGHLHAQNQPFHVHGALKRSYLALNLWINRHPRGFWYT